MGKQRLGFIYNKGSLSFHEKGGEIEVDDSVGCGAGAKDRRESCAEIEEGSACGEE